MADDSAPSRATSDRRAMSEIEFTYAHAAILVSNIERSARFYKRAVGWKKEFGGSYDDSLGRANGYGGPGRILMGKLGGVSLQLVELQVSLEPKQRPSHFGIFMCSVTVRDLAPVRAHLKSENIPITRELDVGSVRLLVVTDPDGQEIGIIGPPSRRERAA
jgi:catechol 2,3-dioxygenase-like lactoylglutathione lyase family enzyme